MDGPAVALGRKLERCPGVLTLGAREDFSRYTEEELELIRAARVVFFPTRRFIDPLAAARRPTFPSEPCYRLSPDRIKQAALFRLLHLPYPRTWIPFGKRQKEVLGELPLPLVAKPARSGSLGKGLRLIETREELAGHLAGPGVKYLQEYVPATRDLRVSVMNFRVVHHYYRVAPEGDFRSSAPAGEIRLESAPREPLEMARDLASSANLNFISVDLVEHRRGWLVLDIGLMQGLRGFNAAGLDPYGIICKMVEKGEL